MTPVKHRYLQLAFLPSPSPCFMDLQLPTQAAAGHRGSHSSIRSTKSMRAAHTQVYTPPHSPTTEYLETPAFDEEPIVIDEIKEDVEIDMDEPISELALTTATEATFDEKDVPAEEQQAELRLSDFEVVDTLGKYFFYAFVFARWTQISARHWHIRPCSSRPFATPSKPTRRCTALCNESTQEN